MSIQGNANAAFSYHEKRHIKDEMHCGIHIP